MIGSVVGNYELLEKLGEGGMGSVFRGRDSMIERDVAIKMLRPEIARQPGVLERFRAEAVALAKLNHPNIATLYSFFRERDEYFMVMEFVKGRTLDSLVRNGPPLPIDQTTLVCSEVLQAIEHAHSYGILHRDIKPANIMVTDSGHVKVTDFGIARVLGTARMTTEGSICGTVEYLAPERIQGSEGDVRSDLYSLGCVLYEMLTGHLPFERDSAFAIMRAHLEETPPPFATFGLSDIPPEMESVVTRAMAKNPDDRFATAEEFRLALITANNARPAVQQQTVRTQPLGTAATQMETAEMDEWPPQAEPVRAFNWRWIAGAVALLIVIAAVIALSINGKQEATRTPIPIAVPQATEPPAASSGTNTTPAEPAANTASEQPDEQRQARDKTDSPPVKRSPSAKQTRGTKDVQQQTSDADRRKAALNALDKTDPDAAKKKAAMDALNK